MAVSDHEQAKQLARHMLDTLDLELDDEEVLAVQCQHGHHVAAVFATGAHLIFRSTIGPHSRGNKDFVDVPHGAHARELYVDLLPPATPLVGDELPGWCACGNWELSRKGLLAAIDAGKRTIRAEDEDPDHVPES